MQVYKYDLPKVPFKLFDESLAILMAYYKEHLRRDAFAGKLQPQESWITLRGLLIGAHQTYAAVCLLLAENRPKRLMLQAGVLNRSLLETLGNVLALCEAPKSRTRMLVRESYKNMAEVYEKDVKRYGNNPKWKDYLNLRRETLAEAAKIIGLSRSEIKNPASIKDRWPTPGKLIYGDKRHGLPAFLRGSRRSAFATLYDFHYGPLSEQAHQRAAAIGAALVVDTYEQWNPGLGESNLVADALLFATCILSELEAKGKYPVHPKLNELWVYLRELSDEAKDVWRLRYRALIDR